MEIHVFRLSIEGELRESTVLKTSVTLITMTSPLTPQAVNGNEINLLILGLIKLLNIVREEQRGKGERERDGAQSLKCIMPLKMEF